jgi:hypothetical protein
MLRSSDLMPCSDVNMNILLFTDNCAAHFEFLPPNMSSVLTMKNSVIKV